MNKILKSTKFVVDNSSFVTINKEKIHEFVDSFEHSHIRHWLLEAPFDFNKLSKDELLHFLLIFNSISFSYWGDPKWAFEYEGEIYDGAYGMIVALGRAIDEGYPVLDFSYLKTISDKDLSHILRGNVDIPLIEERLNILREIGKTITDNYDSNFSNFLKKSNNVLEILKLLVEKFPSFDDTTEYNGQAVYFYKRAQLLLSDIYQMFDGKGFGSFTNPKELTACADYKLPQALRKFGILEYSEELTRKIDEKTELSAESPEEIEIRSGVIWAVEYIREGLDKKGVSSSSMDVNDHLWLLTQTKYPDDKPYHLTRTIAY